MSSLNGGYGLEGAQERLKARYDRRIDDLDAFLNLGEPTFRSKPQTKVWLNAVSSFPALTEISHSHGTSYNCSGCKSISLPAYALSSAVDNLVAQGEKWEGLANQVEKVQGLTARIRELAHPQPLLLDRLSEFRHNDGSFPSNDKTETCERATSSLTTLKHHVLNPKSTLNADEVNTRFADIGAYYRTLAASNSEIADSLVDSLYATELLVKTALQDRYWPQESQGAHSSLGDGSLFLRSGSL